MSTRKDCAARPVMIATMLTSVLTLLAWALSAAPPIRRADTAEFRAIRAAGLKIKTLHATKGETRPGDWLESHHEAGQSFDQYLAANPNGLNRRLTTIYIQPIGEFSAPQQQVVGRAKKLLSIYFGLPVKDLAAVPRDAIPENARRKDPHSGEEQFLTSYVLETLLPPLRPPDAVAVLALTTTDLWPGAGWNFVFGMADLRERVGVYSLSRYGDAADEEQSRVFLRRTLKVAIHETGHMLGIPHCTAFECGMNGSNHVTEMDRNPLGFCPECEQKVWWSCRLNPRNRYESLTTFAGENKLPEEEQLWKASLDRLSPIRVDRGMPQ